MQVTTHAARRTFTPAASSFSRSRSTCARSFGSQANASPVGVPALRRVVARAGRPQRVRRVERERADERVRASAARRAPSASRWRAPRPRPARCPRTRRASSSRRAASAAPPAAAPRPSPFPSPDVTASTAVTTSGPSRGPRPFSSIPMRSSPSTRSLPYAEPSRGGSPTVPELARLTTASTVLNVPGPLIEGCSLRPSSEPQTIRLQPQTCPTDPAPTSEP